MLKLNEFMLNSVMLDVRWIYNVNAESDVEHWEGLEHTEICIQQ